jgi:membrane-bound lytic murein transglycosylase A
MRRGFRSIITVLATIIASDLCLAQPFPDLPQTQIQKLEFAALPRWRDDDHLSAWGVFQTHCAALTKASPVLREGAKPPQALLAICRKAVNSRIATKDEAMAFFETHFQPLDIQPVSMTDPKGFLTGYYEPETTGSLTKTAEFQAPLLARPDDLVTIPQGENWKGLPEGFAAARRHADGSHSIYPNRSAIWSGALGDRAKPILWLRDDVEVFFMQVQGSGRVRLPDGRTVRIAYAGRNGHPYSSIGRIVVREGLLPLEDATLDKLKAWLRAHPVEAKRIMGMNESYVFFRLADELADASGPIGGAGLPLTPWRSIAIDRTIWPYGLPIWIDTELPLEKTAERFSKLTIAEDTGSAILGAARADLYHGSGATAGSRAGVLRHPMRFVVLWPKAQ